MVMIHRLGINPFRLGCLSTFAPLAPGFATKGRELWTFLKALVAILEPR
jgi:hypothetical protein